MTQKRPRPVRTKAGIGTDLRKMSDVRCVSLSYRFTVAVEKFDLEAIRVSMGGTEKTERGFGVCNTLNTETSDYHAHLQWRLRERQKEVRLDIEFVANAIKSRPGEQEPFAENLMPWIGQFFKQRV